MNLLSAHLSMYLSSMCLRRFIMNNWLTWLWRLWCPTVAVYQVEILYILDLIWFILSLLTWAEGAHPRSRAGEDEVAQWECWRKERGRTPFAPLSVLCSVPFGSAISSAEFTHSDVALVWKCFHGHIQKRCSIGHPTVQLTWHMKLAIMTS